METIRVLIADDPPLMLCGIRDTLLAADDIALVGEATRGDDAQRLCAESLPDVLLLDLQMPGASATQTIRYVQTHCPTTRIVILTAYDDVAYVRHTLALGVPGYVLKDEAGEIVLTAIRSIVQGGTWLSRRVLEKMTSVEAVAPTMAVAPRLTKREQQVLDCIARGWRNDRIADELYLKEETVRHYVSALYAKLDIASRCEAMVWAQNHGFGSP